MMKRCGTFLLLFSLVFTSRVVLARPAEDAKTGGVDKELFQEVQILSDAIALISTDYVKPVKAKDLVYGAVRGMAATLDGYSEFLEPEAFKEIVEETRGEFGGVGVEIGISEGILTVISPMEDTPASEAGIKTGDMIVRIEGETTRDMTLDEAVKKLRGASGTILKITVLRESDGKVIDFEIARAVIKLKSIKEASILEEGIGYIKLIEFQEKTPQDFKSSLDTLVAQGATSVIIDLRNNPGGLLDAGIGVADHLLAPGSMIVYTEGRDPGKRTEFRARKKTDFDGLNVIVLVNRGSASAAEILAGAVMDNKRGLVVGETTFGKGSVQTVIPLKDGSGIRITTASYFTPSGKNISDKGIVPDVTVGYYEKTRSSADAEELRKSEVFSGLEEESVSAEEKKEEPKNTERNYDSQLEAAVNILKGLAVFEGYKKPDPSGKETSAS